MNATWLVLILTLIACCVLARQAYKSLRLSVYLLAQLKAERLQVLQRTAERDVLVGAFRSVGWAATLSWVPERDGAVVNVSFERLASAAASQQPGTQAQVPVVLSPGPERAQ